MLVELDGIEPSTSTLPVLIDNLYIQVRSACLKCRFTFIVYNVEIATKFRLWRFSCYDVCSDILLL
jgi:hypothetical protein